MPDDIYRIVTEAVVQSPIRKSRLPWEVQSLPGRLWREKREWFRVEFDLKGQKFGTIGQRHERGQRAVWNKHPGLWQYTRCYCTACDRRLPPLSIGQLLLYKQAKHGCMRTGCPGLYGDNLQDDGTNRRAASLQLTLWKIAAPEVVPLVYGGNHGDPTTMVLLDTPDDTAIRFCQSIGTDYIAANRRPFLSLGAAEDVILPGAVKWARTPSRRLLRALADPTLLLPGLGINLMELEHKEPGAFKRYLRDLAHRKPELNYMTEEEYLMAFPVVDKVEANRVEQTAPGIRHQEFLKEVIEALEKLEVGEAILIGQLPGKMSASNMQAALNRRGWKYKEHWRMTKKIYDDNDNMIFPVWDRPYVLRKLKEISPAAT